MKRTMKRFVASVALVGLAAAPAFAGGKVTIQGSDTLLEMVTAEAAAYMKQRPDVAIQVTGGGSGTGIAALLNGTVDIGNASRAMKSNERKMIEKKGGEVFELAVALDGISFYINKANPVESLSIAQIKDIYTGKIDNWKAVGGPDAKIIRYSRENNSGTYAFVKKHVLNKEEYAADCQNMPGTASVVNAVSKDRNGIGYGGISYSEGVNILKVNGVVPSAETIANDTYPVSRKLYQYTTGKPAGMAKEFMLYELSPEGQALAAKAGYIPLPEKVRKESIASLK